MANTKVVVIFSTYIFSLVTFWSIGGSHVGRSSPFLKTKTTDVGTDSNVSKLHFYVHDRAYGTDRTVYQVPRSPVAKNSPARFDSIEVMNHKIMTGPDRGSAKIGWLQGTITTTEMEVPTFIADLNFRFTGGEYKGSSVKVAGRIENDDMSCEMTVVGGTGLFHSATGYALGSVYFYDEDTSYTIFEFTLHVGSDLQHIARDIK